MGRIQPGRQLLAVAFSAEPGGIGSRRPARGGISLWDVASRHRVGRLLRTAISSAAFSPDGRLLAVAPVTPLAETIPAVAFRPWPGVRLWNLAAGRPAGPSLPWNGMTAVNWTAISPDGKTLAADVHGTMRLWRTPAGRRPVRRLAGDGSPMGPMAFSPHSQTLAAVDNDGTMWLWNAVTGRRIGSPVRTSMDDGTAPVFSPDGQVLAVQSNTDIPALWDPATQQEITDLHGAGDYEVTSMAFTPDGKTLVTADAGGAVRLWDVSYLSDPLAWLCQQIGGSVTRAEWHGTCHPARRTGTPARPVGNPGDALERRSSRRGSRTALWSGNCRVVHVTLCSACSSVAAAQRASP